MTDPRSLTTVATVPDVATAQVLCATLESAGIAGFVPDEHMASMMWVWSQAIGGIRVQVEESQAEAAREALRDLAVAGEPQDAAEEVEPAALSAAESLALRAYRGSLVGFFLWPVLHPITLVQAVVALRRGAGSTARGRSWAGRAVVFSFLSMAMVASMVRWAVG